MTGELSGGRVRRAPALAAGILAVGLVVAAAAVSVSAPDQARVPLGGETDGRDPAELFAHAADVLTESGTFRFDGALVFTDADDQPHPPPTSIPIPTTRTSPAPSSCPASSGR